MICKYCHKEANTLYDIKVYRKRELGMRKADLYGEEYSYMRYENKELYKREECCDECIPKLINPLLVAEEI